MLRLVPTRIVLSTEDLDRHRQSYNARKLHQAAGRHVPERDRSQSPNCESRSPHRERPQLNNLISKEPVPSHSSSYWRNVLREAGATPDARSTLGRRSAQFRRGLLSASEYHLDALELDLSNLDLSRRDTPPDPFQSTNSLRSLTPPLHTSRSEDGSARLPGLDVSFSHLQRQGLVQPGSRTSSLGSVVTRNWVRHTSNSSTAAYELDGTPEEFDEGSAEDDEDDNVFLRNVVDEIHLSAYETSSGSPDESLYSHARTLEESEERWGSRTVRVYIDRPPASTNPHTPANRHDQPPMPQIAPPAIYRLTDGVLPYAPLLSSGDGPSDRPPNLGRIYRAQEQGSMTDFTGQENAVNLNETSSAGDEEASEDPDATEQFLPIRYNTRLRSIWGSRHRLRDLR